ncbi:hypothetical protein OJAV_G00116370 [Oryzias javanicus]|uniref:Uncharacterized protein n=1 Tax=Oryzias javanicus TaxID=123683 RepID=A0A437CRD5_ORYJA|nr:hypothetical protein OJAV_G00116370 [Oryzias javanicus]
MQPGPQTSSSSSHHTRPELSSAPRRGMDRALQPQTPQPPKTCSSSGMTGKACWSWDLKVALILVTLAGALILLLLFRLLQLRHRLNLVRAGHPLEYSGFYHSATYTLRQPTPCQDLPAKNGIFSEKASTIQTVTVVTPAVSNPVPPPPVTPQPSLPLPSHPVLPPPPLHTALSLPPTPRVLSFPLPVISTTPPSPHLSWGACSDADVYSRIGAFRPSRLSSLSSQSTVILFEHSALI